MTDSQQMHEARESGDDVSRMSPAEEIARKLDLLLERFPKADGRRWRGVDVERATGGAVSSSYFSGLRRAKFDDPGLKRLSLVADVIGFPFELWRLDPAEWEEELARHREHAWQARDHRSHVVGDAQDPGEYRARDVTRDDPFVAAFGLYEEDVTVPESPRIPAGEELADLLNILFESKPDPRTGSPYTNDRVARLSRARLTREQIARMRAGGQTAPPAEITLIALSQVFGVPVSYWYVSDETKPVIDLARLEEALADLLSDDRVLVVRSSEEGDGAGGRESTHTPGQNARREQDARKLVAALLNRVATDTTHTTPPGHRRRAAG